MWVFQPISLRGAARLAFCASISTSLVLVTFRYYSGISHVTEYECALADE